MAASGYGPLDSAVPDDQQLFWQASAPLISSLLNAEEMERATAARSWMWASRDNLQLGDGSEDGDQPLPPMASSVHIQVMEDEDMPIAVDQPDISAMVEELHEEALSRQAAEGRREAAVTLSPSLNPADHSAEPMTLSGLSWDQVEEKKPKTEPGLGMGSSLAASMIDRSDVASAFVVDLTDDSLSANGGQNLFDGSFSFDMPMEEAREETTGERAKISEVLVMESAKESGRDQAELQKAPLASRTTSEKELAKRKRKKERQREKLRQKKREAAAAAAAAAGGASLTSSSTSASPKAAAGVDAGGAAGGDTGDVGSAVGKDADEAETEKRLKKMKKKRKKKKKKEGGEAAGAEGAEEKPEANAEGVEQEGEKPEGNANQQQKAKLDGMEKERQATLQKEKQRLEERKRQLEREKEALEAKERKVQATSLLKKAEEEARQLEQLIKSQAAETERRRSRRISLDAEKAMKAKEEAEKKKQEAEKKKEEAEKKRLEAEKEEERKELEKEKEKEREAAAKAKEAEEQRLREAEEAKLKNSQARSERIARRSRSRGKDDVQMHDVPPKGKGPQPPSPRDSSKPVRSTPRGRSPRPSADIPILLTERQLAVAKEKEKQKQKELQAEKEKERQREKEREKQKRKEMEKQKEQEMEKETEKATEQQKEREPVRQTRYSGLRIPGAYEAPLSHIDLNQKLPSVLYGPSGRVGDETMLDVLLPDTAAAIRRGLSRLRSKKLRAVMADSITLLAKMAPAKEIWMGTMVCGTEAELEPHLRDRPHATRTTISVNMEVISSCNVAQLDKLASFLGRFLDSLFLLPRATEAGGFLSLVLDSFGLLCLTKGARVVSLQTLRPAANKRFFAETVNKTLKDLTDWPFLLAHFSVHGVVLGAKCLGVTRKLIPETPPWQQLLALDGHGGQNGPDGGGGAQAQQKEKTPQKENRQQKQKIRQKDLLVSSGKFSGDSAAFFASIKALEERRLALADEIAFFAKRDSYPMPPPSSTTSSSRSVRPEQTPPAPTPTPAPASPSSTSTPIAPRTSVSVPSTAVELAIATASLLALVDSTHRAGVGQCLATVPKELLGPFLRIFEALHRWIPGIIGSEMMPWPTMSSLEEQNGHRKGQEVPWVQVNRRIIDSLDAKERERLARLLLALSSSPGGSDDTWVASSDELCVIMVYLGMATVRPRADGRSLVQETVDMRLARPRLFYKLRLPESGESLVFATGCAPGLLIDSRFFGRADGSLYPARMTKRSEVVPGIFDVNLSWQPDDNRGSGDRYSDEEGEAEREQAEEEEEEEEVMEVMEMEEVRDVTLVGGVGENSRAGEEEEEEDDDDVPGPLLLLGALDERSRTTVSLGLREVPEVFLEVVSRFLRKAHAWNADVVPQLDIWPSLQNLRRSSSVTVGTSWREANRWLIDSLAASEQAMLATTLMVMLSNVRGCQLDGLHALLLLEALGMVAAHGQPDLELRNASVGPLSRLLFVAEGKAPLLFCRPEKGPGVLLLNLRYFGRSDIGLYPADLVPRCVAVEEAEASAGLHPSRRRSGDAGGWILPKKRKAPEVAEQPRKRFKAPFDPFGL